MHHAGLMLNPDPLETTWSLDQLGHVSRLQGKFEVSELVLRRHPGAVDRACEQAARRLVRMAESYAVVPHLGDFRRQIAAQTDDDEARMVHRVTVWWEPRTQEVEIRGMGELDGTLYEVRDAPRTSLFLHEEPAYLAIEDADPTALADAPKLVELTLVGWREQARRWVYARRERRDG